MVTLEEMVANPGVREQIDRMLDAPRGILAINGGDASGKTTTVFVLAEQLRLRGRPVRVILFDPELRNHLLATSSLKDWDIRMIADTPEEWSAAVAAAGTDGIVVVQHLDYRNARLLVDAARAGATLLTQVSTPFIGIDSAYSLMMMGIPNAEIQEVFSFIMSQMLV